MTPAIHVESLTKTFGATVAVDDVSLTVQHGEIYGFLGRNGAGKTTTIRLLLGMLKPSGGRVSLLGQAVEGHRGPWGRVGTLVENAVAWPELSVIDHLRTMADYYGIRGRQAIDRVLEQLNLVTLVSKPTKHLSQGNLQRLALASALLPRPELLILDEPTNALDPSGVVEIRELLIGLARDHGTTVFVSSHLLDEVSRLCTRMGLMHEGRLIEEVDAAHLPRLTNPRLIVETSDPVAAERVLRDSGVPLGRVTIEPPDLETYFLQRTGGNA